MTWTAGTESGRLKPGGPSRYLLAFALLLLADVAYLSPALLTSAVRAPADVTPHWPPFLADRLERPPPPKNELLNDWLVQFHPWRHLVSDAWSSGRAPLWNERSGCGEPLLANLQCGALSPYVAIDLIAGDQSSDWKQLAQLAVAQAFCLLLAAHLGLSAAAGAIVALAFGFSSFMQIWALHPHSASASFAPGILWALLRLTAAPSAWRFLVAAGCVGLSVLAGHVETAAKAGLFAGAVVLLHDLIKAPASGRGRGAMLVVSAGVCGLLLAACALAPFLDYVSQSDTRDVRAQYAGAGIPVVQLATLLDPGWFGTALNPRTWHGSGSYPDGVVHVGVVALALAAAGAAIGFLRRTHVAVPLAAVSTLAILVACGPAGIRDLWAAAPGLGDIRPWRCLSVVILPLAIFAGFGFDEGARVVGRLPTIPRAFVAAGLVAATALTSALPWRGFIPTAAALDLHPPSRALDALRARAASGRSLELGRTLPAGLGEIYGFSRLVRYDAIGLRRFSDVFAAEETFPVFPNVGQVTFAPAAILDALSVRWVLSPYPAAEARLPTKPWPIETTEGATVGLDGFRREGRLPEILLFRGHGQSVRDGSVQIVLRGPGVECTWTLEPGGWKADAGEPPLDGHSFAVDEFLATQLRGFDTEVIAIPPALAAATRDVTFRLQGRAASFQVAALDLGGVGRDVAEVENQGWLRIAERSSALPFAYFAAGIVRSDDQGEAVKLVRAAGFDPHSRTIVEAPPEVLLPMDAAISAAESAVLRRPEPGRIEVQVHSASPRLLVVTEAFARGWTATVDGVETDVYPANAIVMACVVPAGDQVVELVYRPRSFTVGWVISVVTLVVLLGLAALDRRL